MRYTYDEVADMTLAQFLSARRGESVLEDYRKACDLVDKGIDSGQPGAVLLSGPAEIAAYMAEYKRRKADELAARQRGH